MRVDLVLELARERKDERARSSFLQSLFSSSASVGALLDRGHFEALYELASSDSDPAKRAGHLAQLLANAKTVEHLVANKKIELLLNVAGEQSDELGNIHGRTAAEPDNATRTHVARLRKAGIQHMQGRIGLHRIENPNGQAGVLQGCKRGVQQNQPYKAGIGYKQDARSQFRTR